MLSARTDIKSPVRGQAKAILRKLHDGFELINKRFYAALNASPANEIISDSLFQEICLALRKYLHDIHSEITIADMMIMVDQYKYALSSLYDEFDRLPLKKKNAFNALIDFHKILAVQCCLLSQIATLGGQLHEYENKSIGESVSATVVLSKADAKGNHLKKCLLQKTSLLEADLESLVVDNELISRHVTECRESINLYVYEQSLIVKKFKEEFQSLLIDFSQFNAELTDFRRRLHEEISSNAHDSGKTNRIAALNEIRKNITTLAAHFNTINAKNILTFENDLENKDGIQAEINNLAQALATYEATHKEKERVLVSEANQLQIKFVSLQNRLQFYQNPTGEYAVKLNTCREAINNEEADRVLTPLSKLVDVSKFHLVRQAEADYKDLRSHEFDLIRAENSLQTALNTNRQIIENLCESSALTMMLELKESRKLSASMQARSFATENVLESFSSQYSGIYALISADEENLKKYWIEAENAIRFVTKDTEGDIHSLQETINTRTREEEIHAISHNIDHQSDEIARLARVIQNLRISFTQASAIYETKKRELVDGVRLQLNEIHTNAKAVLHKEKQALIRGIDLLLDEVVNYRADSTVSAIDKIKLVDDKAIANLNSDIANLRLSFAAKMSLLNKAKTKRDHQVRKREFAEIERHARDHHKHHEHVDKSEQNPQETNRKKPGFFRRHWKIITAATMTIALCGAGAGAAIALFTSVPTLGLGMIAIPVFAATGFVLGAAAGFLSGVFGCAVKDCCCPANKERRAINIESSTLNYGATGNIQSALGVQRRSDQTIRPAKQYVSLNSDTANVREADANPPPLTVMQQERADTRPEFRRITPHTAHWQPIPEDIDLPRLSVIREDNVQTARKITIPRAATPLHLSRNK